MAAKDEVKVYTVSRNDNLKKAPVWLRALASGKGLALGVKRQWTFEGKPLKEGDVFTLNENGSVSFKRGN